MQRSGGTLLERLLNSHPDITCLGEILANPDHGDRSLKNFQDIVDKNEVKTAGFHVQYGQMQSNTQPVAVDALSYFKENNFKVINLIRRNILRTAMFIKGCCTHTNNGFIINPKLLEKNIKVILMHIEYYKPIVGLKMFYEDFTNNGCYVNEFSNYELRKEMLEFLGVDDHPLCTNFDSRSENRFEIKGDIFDICENYKELKELGLLKYLNYNFN